MTSKAEKILQWTTLPKIAKATGLSVEMIRDMADCGLLQTFKNPATSQQGKRARYLIAQSAVKKWLTTVLVVSEDQTQTILRQLF